MEQDFHYKSTPQKSPVSQKNDTLAALSLVAGIFGLTSCCFPPLQLLLGVAAIMLAVISKKDGATPGMAKVGRVLGAIALVLSILIFVYFLFAMQLIKDPANAEMVQEIMRQYQELFDGISAGQ